MSHRVRGIIGYLYNFPQVTTQEDLTTLKAERAGMSEKGTKRRKPSDLGNSTYSVVVHDWGYKGSKRRQAWDAQISQSTCVLATQVRIYPLLPGSDAFGTQEFPLPARSEHGVPGYTTDD